MFSFLAGIFHKIGVVVGMGFIALGSAFGGSAGAAPVLAPVQNEIVASSSGTQITFSATSTQNSKVTETKDTPAKISKPIAIDVCQNIEGIQTTLPQGFSENSGVCSPITVKDVCPNIDGVQSKIPDGLLYDPHYNQCLTSSQLDALDKQASDAKISTSNVPGTGSPIPETPPTATVAVPVSVIDLGGNRLVDSGITTFRFKIINNSSQILTITKADIRLVLGDGLVETPITKLGVSGSVGYLAPTLLTELSKSFNGGYSATFSDTPINVLPYASETFDIDVASLSGEFAAGTTAKVVIDKFYSPDAWAVFNTLPLENVETRLK